MMGWIALAVAAGAIGVLVGSAIRRGAPRAPEASPLHAPGEQVIEISALAGGLVHEIRNPLSTLKVNLQLLAEDWNDDAIPVQELRRRSLQRLATLHGEANRLHDILDDFLRLIGAQELQFAEVELGEVIREFIAFYEPQAQAKNVHVRLVLPDGPLVARVDAGLFKQVLLNLCINAQEAMPQGGELTIRLERDASGQARIEVSDTGAGLPPESITHIFEPFYSTKPRGTGLGLALSRRIIRSHGGAIAAENASAGGAVFVIRLPLSQGE